MAFFDLDRTLLPAHTSLMYLQELRAEGRVGVLTVVRAAVYLVLYFFNVVDTERVVRTVLRRAAGDPDEQGWERGRRCAHQRILPRVSEAARAAMAEHRARGERVCIISASPAYVVEPVAAALGADALCTRLAAVDGRLTGTLDGPMMHGQNKVVAARAYAAAHGVELSACRFYSDSVSDLPLLSAVGHPVAVNADPGLARHARRAGWRRERWTD